MQQPADGGRLLAVGLTRGSPRALAARVLAVQPQGQPAIGVRRGGGRDDPLKIVETVPWIDAEYDAATQVVDEARHVALG